MDWTSFFIGLLTFPIVISGLFVARIFLELLLSRRVRQPSQVQMSQESAARP